MPLLVPRDALLTAVDVVKAGVTSGSIKLLGAGNATMGGTAVENSTQNAAADAAYLNALISAVSENLAAK